MANEDIDSGLFNISLGSDTEEDAEGQDASKPPARDRTGQTEEQFQAVRRTYRAKVENGEVSVPFLFLPPFSPFHTVP